MKVVLNRVSRCKHYAKSMRIIIVYGIQKINIFDKHHCNTSDFNRSYQYKSSKLEFWKLGMIISVRGSGLTKKSLFQCIWAQNSACDPLKELFHYVAVKKKVI